MLERLIVRINEVKCLLSAVMQKRKDRTEVANDKHAVVNEGKDEQKIKKIGRAHWKIKEREWHGNVRFERRKNRKCIPTG